ncbi:MAG: helix-turn-helix transcriptional regulator [Oscillospiraceae bacterium]|nr:helix-turn-helix transcriptional regulator [Oscillospiraceae bacterium]
MDSSSKEKKQQLNKELGLRIKEARKNAKLTQEQLSEYLNVNTQFISDLERGICGPSLITLSEISSILGVTTDYLIKGQPSHKQTETSYSLIIGSRQYILTKEEFDIMEKNVDSLLSAFRITSR